MSKQWYVVRVQTGRERKIKEGLEKRVKESALETEITSVLVPTEKITEIRSGKKMVKERKLYPGYIMIEMELNERTWYTVRETPGIGDFLGLKTPVPMAKHEVERILTEASSVEDKPKIKIDVQKGDSIRIKEGPFENFDGVVEDVNTTKGLVSVTITIFGRATKVDLEYWQIEKI